MKKRQWKTAFIICYTALSLGIVCCYSTNTGCHGNSLVQVDFPQSGDSIWMTVYRDGRQIFSDSAELDGQYGMISTGSDTTKGAGNYVVNLTLLCEKKKIEISPLSFNALDNSATTVTITFGNTVYGNKIPLTLQEYSCPGISEIAAYIDRNETCL